MPSVFADTCRYLRAQEDAKLLWTNTVNGHGGHREQTSLLKALSVVTLGPLSYRYSLKGLFTHINTRWKGCACAISLHAVYMNVEFAITCIALKTNYTNIMIIDVCVFSD